ncbi:DUF3768 domain-containing protein [Croceicoccus naphthovorans]|uniref:DUF3768 domain-containing protein n=1 Tax=Croceicoccus naphthovorans TaxID=1348774 RepID=A0A0G3XNR3_9SPHN|nr:DUF3768 domain-containing protein [Croceicoccus naphthovorans]AKM12159.1 hypothetical protein AB433_18630 [Croceicoccus naphthovorans]AKM12246.1 hypothetical protein AB433_19135 [Croceicoccus naphthovorans]MBB3990997.1 hypothetical protein [Croceicoccus naphthovorans]
MAQPAQASCLSAEQSRAGEIARLNDAARAGTLANSRMVFTRNLVDLLAGDADDAAIAQVRQFQNQAALLRLVRETPIDPGNDPNGERDFGVVTFLDRKIFWKVDVYENDGTFEWGAEAPWDEQTSYRVVTVMLATDY